MMRHTYVSKRSYTLVLLLSVAAILAFTNIPLVSANDADRSYTTLKPNSYSGDGVKSDPVWLLTTEGEFTEEDADDITIEFVYEVNNVDTTITIKRVDYKKKGDLVQLHLVKKECPETSELTRVEVTLANGDLIWYRGPGFGWRW